MGHTSENVNLEADCMLDFSRFGLTYGMHVFKQWARLTLLPHTVRHQGKVCSHASTQMQELSSFDSVLNQYWMLT